MHLRRVGYYGCPHCFLTVLLQAKAKAIICLFSIRLASCILHVTGSTRFHDRFLRLRHQSFGHPILRLLLSHVSSKRAPPRMKATQEKVASVLVGINTFIRLFFFSLHAAPHRSCLYCRRMLVGRVLVCTIDVHIRRCLTG